MEDLVGDESTDGVEGRGLALLDGLLPVLRCDIPDQLVDLVILELVEDAI